MPELPEVESIVRSIRPLVLGRRITGVEFPKGATNGSPKLSTLRVLAGPPRAFREAVCGSFIEGVERYGKNIVLRLRRRNGKGRFSLVIHLGMTGRLTCETTPEFQSRHTHLVLSLDAPGCWIHYNDIRQFGRIRLGDSSLDDLERLGPDPLEISFEEFFQRLHGRQARVKSLLLDQRFLRGLGNIYADESLFQAGIHPAAWGSQIRQIRALRLFRAIRETLLRAIQAGGSSVSNYVDGRGRSGSFQRLHQVYRREGQSCSRCGSRIRRIQIASRSSHFCPRCQRGGRDVSPRRLAGKR